MQINRLNRCPRCRREPSFNKLFNIKLDPIGYEVECYDCGFHSGRCETREEAVAKWNEMTEEIK